MLSAIVADCFVVRWNGLSVGKLLNGTTVLAKNVNRSSSKLVLTKVKEAATQDVTPPRQKLG